MQVRDGHDHDASLINSEDNSEGECSCYASSGFKMHYGIDHRVDLYMTDGILNC